MNQLHTVDLKLLRVFAEIVKCGGFSAAQAALNIGHSTISDQMTHLESRPLEGKPFEYFFHIDVMGSLKDPSNTRTLEGLSSMCSYFKILGNYESCGR